LALARRSLPLQATGGARADVERFSAAAGDRGATDPAVLALHATRHRFTATSSPLLRAFSLRLQQRPPCGPCLGAVG